MTIWIIFISMVVIFSLLFIYDIKTEKKKSAEQLGDDESLFDPVTGTTFTIEDVEKNEIEFASDSERIKTDQEIESNYHPVEIPIEKTKNYLRRKGYRTFDLGEIEDPELLNELSLFDAYTEIHFNSVFKISDRKLLIFVKVTYELQSGEVREIHSEMQLLLWYKSQNSAGHLNANEELFIENLKSSKQISFLRRVNNYFFKTKRLVCVEDVDLFLNNLNV